MAEYVITTDTTSDLPESYLAENGIKTLKLGYTIDGVTYGKEKNLDLKEFYALMRAKKMPTTNACNPEDALEVFEGYLKEGKDILHIAFSSGLSTSYNSAMIAKNELDDKYPERKIIVVDSLCASLGEGLLVHKAVCNRKAGMSVEENGKWCEDHKLNVCHQFTVDDLFNLQRGGRVSKTVAVIGTLVNVKPVLHVDNEGHLIPLCNVRGRKKSLITLVDNMEEAIKGCDLENDIVFISHGDSEEDAKFVADQVKSRFGIESFLINIISPTIGAHAGPGTIALFHMGTSR
ncbi:MAG: DegV family protein [Lachnospiraceae bacterium]|nr:DegV family protein [Lachnospiraceae bacterium]